MKANEKTYKEKYGVNKFIPKSNNPLPWKVLESDIWSGVVASNGKRVCNCRNIKDAELIVSSVNSLTNQPN